MHLIDSLEAKTDWGKIFGVVDSLYNDKGFSSNADNFARATAVEKAIAKFSDLDRVDQTGYDFLFGDKKVELKMGKNLFYKRKDVHATKKFKVKSFLSETKTVEDFKKIKTFDYMMVIDLTARRVVIVEDEKARSLYQDGADGAMIELKLGDYYECNLGEFDVTEPPASLSESINNAIEGYLDF
tara:strand:+ start:46179 stop:46730 length:552 start_codon:yes stop_codon:yes gene_type:complete